MSVQQLVIFVGFPAYVIVCHWFLVTDIFCVGASCSPKTFIFIYVCLYSYLALFFFFIQINLSATHIFFSEGIFPNEIYIKHNINHFRYIQTLKYHVCVCIVLLYVWRCHFSHLRFLLMILFSFSVCLFRFFF